MPQRILPPGFDPATGRLRGVGGSRTVNTSTSRPTPSHRSPSGSYGPWDKFNDGVGSIGNWMSGWIDTACTVVMWIIIAGVALLALWGIISLFAEGHVFGAIVAIVLGFTVIYYGASIVGYIGYIITAVILYALRFVFWNAWSLIATFVVVGGLIVWDQQKPVKEIDRQDYQIEQVATTTYRCTAKKLNVRSGPGTNYGVIGVLSKNERIEVITIEDKFAKFRYNGGYGYAGVKYLEIVY